MVVWSRMVVSVSVVYPGHGVTDARCSCHYPESQERIISCITRLLVIQGHNSKLKVKFLLNVYHFDIIIKSVDMTI